MTTPDLTMHCDPDRPSLARPFSMDGWTCATEGHYLVAIHTNALDEAVSPNREIIKTFLNEPSAEGFKCSLLDLRKFVGEVPSRVPCPDCSNGQTTCRECDGEGKIACLCEDGKNPDGDVCTRCNGTIREPCSICDGDGHYPCDFCDGAGTLDPPRRVGWIFGVSFDLNLVARALTVARADDAISLRWSQLSHALAIHGATWRVAIMPLRADMDSDEWKNAPAWGEGKLAGEPEPVAMAEGKPKRKRRKS